MNWQKLEKIQDAEGNIFYRRPDGGKFKFKEGRYMQVRWHTGQETEERIERKTERVEILRDGHGWFIDSEIPIFKLKYLGAPVDVALEDVELILHGF